MSGAPYQKSDDTRYFAAVPDAEIVGRLYDKVTKYYEHMAQYAFAEKVKKSYAYNAGGTLFEGHVTWKISRMGEDGEVLANFENQYRSIAQSMLNLTTSQRPSVEVIAKNGDKASITNALIGKGLIDFYLSEQGLEQMLRQVVEMAIIGAEGFIFTSWNQYLGDRMGQVGPDGQPGPAVPMGDVQFRVFDTFDVVRDPYSNGWKNCQWVILRTWVNKYDLAAMYPEIGEELKTLGIGDEAERRIIFDKHGDNIENIAVWEFYHEKTPAMPDGRYVKFVKNHWLEGGPLPYQKIPLARCAPSDMIGTPFGYTPMFDLLGCQETINGLDTSITTNQLGRGIGNMLVPSGANITVDQMATHMNAITYDGQLEPKPLAFPNTPAELFQFKKDKIAAMEVLSGQNSVIRGSPNESVGADASGSKLALLQAQASQQNSGLEKTYVQLIRDVGLNIIHIYRDFGGSLDRIVKIVGKHNKFAVKDFVPQDAFKEIDNISVDIGNPVTRQISGRIAIADRLTELGLIKPENANYWLQLVKEGTLDPLTSGQDAQNFRIEEENENLMEGKPHRALISDPHWLEIPKHLEILDNPDLRGIDPASQQIQTAVLNAVQEHMQLFMQMPPGLVMMRGGANALAMWQQMQGMPAPMPGQPPPKGPAGNPNGKTTGGSVQDQQAKESMAAQPEQPAQPKNPATGQSNPTPTGVTNPQ